MKLNIMFRILKRALMVLAVVGTGGSVSAFSLRGPLDTWQTAAIGYNPLGTDSGGPMNLGEGYRWNLRTITYGFDSSFMHYFGASGSNAIVQAMDTFNKLPPFSKMSADLSEFPFDTVKVNQVAESLGILDLKSVAMGLVLGELGVASSERYTWTLRDRRPLAPPPGFQYLVIQRNFDPVRFVPSPYVNNILYTYGVIDPIPIQGGSYADAIEIPLDPDALHPFSAVSSIDSIIAADALQLFNVGSFFTGLTRDDVGALRYLYIRSKNNSYVETLVAGATNGLASSGGSPWGTVSGSNVLVNVALRTGIDKLQFKLFRADSVFSGFPTVTNTFTDTYFTNNFKQVKQSFQRVVNLPDILFAAGDLGLDSGGNPIIEGRTLADGNWTNNAALNSVILTAGPGQINGGIVITFSKLGPYIFNQTSAFLDQANTAGIGLVWGSFDGTTNAPTIYPVGTTIQDREQMVFFNP